MTFNYTFSFFIDGNHGNAEIRFIPGKEAAWDDKAPARKEHSEGRNIAIGSF